MPNPTRSDVHVNRPLTNISIAYMQSADMFVAADVFPVVSVPKRSDTYFIYDRGDFFRDEAQERAPGTESAAAGYRISQDSYVAKRYALHTQVDDERLANEDDPLSAEIDDTNFISQKLLLKRETVFADGFFTTGVWTDLTGVAAAPAANQFIQWNEAASDPIKDITDASVAMAGATGFRPNLLILNPEVFNVLRQHPDVLDNIKFTGNSSVTNITEAVLAQAFNIDRVRVAWSVQNSAVEGATEATDFIYSKAALLLYRPAAAGLRTPSAGYTFAWTGIFGAGALGGRMLRIPTPLLGDGSFRVEGELYFDFKRVATELGTFFATAIA